MTRHGIADAPEAPSRAARAARTDDRITLSAGLAKAEIAPREGGMVTALRVDGRDILVPDRARMSSASGPVPRFGSFLMAPWVGELFLGQLAFRGRTATIPPNQGRHAVHGLVTEGPWVIDEATPTAARLWRRLPPPWPFGGLVRQTIALDEDGITLEAEIQAEEDAMPAALGWHPWFAAADPGAVRVGVRAGAMLELDDELLPTGRILPVDGDNDLRDLPILGTRPIDTVFVGALSPAVLRTPSLDIEIHFDPAIAQVVVFTSPGAVCIEPWSAWPDCFRAAAAGHPSGATVLEPGQILRRRTRWSWRRLKNGMDNEAARWLPSSHAPLATEWTKS